MNVGLLALAAAVPIALAFGLLVGARKSAALSMSVGWIAAVILGIAVWQMDLSWLAASAAVGALEGLNIVLIVFGAVLLMNYLDLGGAIGTIRWFFHGIERDRRVQLLLIGLGFETIIEGAAGFGTPGALAAPLFVGLGFPPLAAAVFGLFFNAPNPQFGAAGTPILGGISTGTMGDLVPESAIGALQMTVSAWSGVMTGLTFVFWGLLGVFLLIYWFGDDAERSIRGAARSTLPIAPFALVAGTTAGLIQWAVAWTIGPELPDIAAGFVVLGLGIVMANYGVLVPDDAWTFPDREQWSDVWLGGLSLDGLGSGAPEREMPVWLAWAPYLAVGLFLLVTRWPTFDLVSRLKEFTVGFGFDLPMGTQTWTLEYLYLPGTMPFVPVAVGTGLLFAFTQRDRLAENLDGEASLPDGLDRRLAGVHTGLAQWTRYNVAAWRESLRQVGPAAVTLIVAVSLTQVMIASATNASGALGMMESLSTVLASAAGGALPAVTPWIGALGTFVTGSNTTSDILFNALQYQAAVDVGLEPSIILAIQNVGGGVGNMISVLNVAAICGVVGLSGREGDILRKVVVPTVIFALFAGGVGTAIVYLI
ncbi:L-lactate permease [Halococcoides cellulosivorans]|uniref:Lactate permease n=1 Tax=Halococcoides cellulosivorans TaxID=1679096 RepID=A0A2R4X2R1_9EURY|nr:L-lactate permease [Halococcoides cellulosivorans]AWB28099.1 lactate permease [Halococcoides cellulosivorans]